MDTKARIEECIEAQAGLADEIAALRLELQAQILQEKKWFIGIPYRVKSWKLYDDGSKIRTCYIKSIDERGVRIASAVHLIGKVVLLEDFENALEKARIEGGE